MHVTLGYIKWGAPVLGGPVLLTCRMDNLQHIPHRSNPLQICLQNVPTTRSNSYRHTTLHYQCPVCKTVCIFVTIMLTTMYGRKFPTLSTTVPLLFHLPPPTPPQVG